MTSNIILIGFMGTGKSAVSAELASLSGWSAVDTDVQIVQQQGQSIPELFAEQGEAYFRKCETDVLAQVLAKEQQIIATGGGAVLAAKNRQLMLDNGFVVCLFANPETIVERVSHHKDRPLLAGDARKKVVNLLEERGGAYDFAHIKIDTTKLTVKEIAEKIWQAWEQRL